jgi:hypothetical protein
MRLWIYAVDSNYRYFSRTYKKLLARGHGTSMDSFFRSTRTTTSTKAQLAYISPQMGAQRRSVVKSFVRRYDARFVFDTLQFPKSFFV